MTTSETRRLTVSAAEEIMDRYFPVLDHGFVALVDYMGGDRSMERAARVSFGSKMRGEAESRTLLRHLRRHMHTSPSEMCEIVLHCAMPLFIARQWIRHRTASVNEYSGRYSLMPMLFYTPPRELVKRQSKSDKQGRAGDSLTELEYSGLVARWNNSRVQAVDHYREMTEDDLAKELARIDLPLSTYTQWYWKIDMHNLMHFLSLRVDAHAQAEIQAYGRIIAGMTKRLAPLTHEAWIDYKVCAVTFSRHERVALADLITDGVRIGDGIAKAARLEALGDRLSPRERDEFVGKIQELRMANQAPNFDLDLSVTKDPEYFEQKYAAATLAGDR